MSEIIELIGTAVVMGVAGSALIDAWAFFLRRTLHVNTLDYAMLGRWIGHFPQGRFFHQRIGAAASVRGERPLGWLAHYSIRTAFAFVLLWLWGLDWAHSPTIGPAMVVGVGTVFAPWLVMQPAFGAGIAGSKTPNPTAGRLRNFQHTRGLRTRALSSRCRPVPRLRDSEGRWCHSQPNGFMQQ